MARAERRGENTTGAGGSKRGIVAAEDKAHNSGTADSARWRQMVNADEKDEGGGGGGAGARAGARGGCGGDDDCARTRVVMRH